MCIRDSIRTFIETGHLKGRENVLHVHLCPMAEAMKEDFRFAGRHNDIVVALDLHLMMDRGFRFSLREVPSEYFIAECEHGPSVDDGRGPVWDKNFIIAMGSVAHFSIVFVNVEAVTEINRQHNEQEPTTGGDAVEWKGIECLTDGSYPFILQHSKYGLPHLIGNLVVTGVHFPDTVTYFNGALRLAQQQIYKGFQYCLLYTSPSPRDATLSRMPSSA